MNGRTLRLVFAAAALAASPAALAHADTLAPKQLSAAAPELAFAPVVASVSAAEPALELLHVSVPDVQMAGVHYRPRGSQHWGRRVDSETASQIHVGFLDPEGDPGRQFLLGVRGGPMIDSHLQLGVGVDWSHISDNISSVSHESIGPNGQTITVKQDLARASTHLFPLMAFAQFSGDDNMGVIPYFGAAGGYEVMNLSAENFQTNASFDATYGGWGWQLWGGAAIPLSGRSRVDGEIFVNTAELGRDVNDPALGGTYRETVKANGIGMRLGLAWGF
jgi:hypothetical protein